MKPQVYKDPRPAEYFTQFHRAARRKIGWTYNLARLIVTLPTLLLYRVRTFGLENVPRHGAVVLAPNHFSQMDHFFVALLLPRRICFMAKSQLFGPPVLTYVYKHGGAFPIRRGHRDEEAIGTSHAILDRGDTLLVYAEGGRSRSGELGEPKPGVGRIALESGAPIVPVAIYGSATVRRWKRLRFPRVTVEYGEPVTYPVERAPSRERQLQVAGEIFARVREMYEGLATRSEIRSGHRSPDRARA